MLCKTNNFSVQGLQNVLQHAFRSKLFPHYLSRVNCAFLLGSILVGLIYKPCTNFKFNILFFVLFFFNELDVTILMSSVSTKASLIKSFPALFAIKLSN